MQWCNSNSTCGGFAVSGNTCYFKSHACGNDLINSSNVLYMKQGRNTMAFHAVDNDDNEICYILPVTFTDVQTMFWRCFKYSGDIVFNYD